MHAFIISSNQVSNVKFKVDEICDNEHIANQIYFVLQKIEDARELKKVVKFVFNTKTAVIIEDIDKATVDAANAFLKNLEEPNKNLIYILTTTNLSNVLPTITSRCEVIITKNNELKIVSKEVKQFLELNINQKIDYITKIKDRGDAIKFIEDIIYLDFEKHNFKNQENCLKTLRNLKSNGNVSLQLTNFVVTMNG